MEADREWKALYRVGAWSTVIVLIGIVADIGIGSATGGNISALPQTAIGRFEQLQQNWLLGLYNLDLLNVVNQLFLIPAYLALYIVLRDTHRGYALLALVIFIVGTVIFVMNNSALAMLDLSKSYSASYDTQRLLYAAAGEAMLAKGAHGGLNVFIGFLLPNLAGGIMAFVMVRGSVFAKWTGYLGLIGSVLLCAYVILVTFVPAVRSTATAIAAPGGLLVLAWMIVFTRTLFRLSK